jgi:photosystem II stability/assembly factor-like uncharacterized protein
MLWGLKNEDHSLLGHCAWPDGRHRCRGNWQGKVCLDEFQIQCVAVDPNRNGVAYCGTFGNGMFRSKDCGRTWSALSGLKEPNVMALAAAYDGTVYAGTELSAISARSFVYRRTGNNAWQLLCNGLPTSEGSRIAVVTASHVEPGIFYCSTEGRVYRSADDGLRWQELGVQWNRGTHTEHAFDMAITEER